MARDGECCGLGSSVIERGRDGAGSNGWLPERVRRIDLGRNCCICCVGCECFNIETGRDAVELGTDPVAEEAEMDDDTDAAAAKAVKDSGATKGVDSDLDRVDDIDVGFSLLLLMLVLSSLRRR